MSVTFLFREAGIAATLGRRGLARPAVLWNLVIATGLQQCENLVNVAPQNKVELPDSFSFRMAWEKSTEFMWIRTAL
jgi:hypothetical protein